MPFTKPLKCSLDDSFFKLSSKRSFAMVANPQQQLAYSRKGSGSLPLKMKLNLAAFNERCDKFHYHFNGAKFELSMDTSQKVDFSLIRTIRFTSVPTDSWEVKMVEISWIGRFKEVRVRY